MTGCPVLFVRLARRGADNRLSSLWATLRLTVLKKIECQAQHRGRATICRLDRRPDTDLTTQAGCSEHQTRLSREKMVGLVGAASDLQL